MYPRYMKNDVCHVNFSSGLDTFGHIFPIRSHIMSKSVDEGARLFGHSRTIQDLLLKVSRVAATRISVLIVGESGAGKDIVARLIHDMSPRRRGPFVPVNCGAIPHDIAESQLFGHEKGSFTGAISQHVGMFEAARGGTLFLDEIAEMPAELQVKLLRTLETNTIVRVGGHEPIPIDVRIVAATITIRSRRCAPGGCARTCSTGSRQSRCTCPRSGSARTMSAISRCRSWSG